MKGAKTAIDKIAIYPLLWLYPGFIVKIVRGKYTNDADQHEQTDRIDLESLFKEFYDRLVYFSLQFVNDKEQARDIVQDAFIKYWHQKDCVASNKTAIKNFLYTTVRHASLNVIRHLKVVADYVQLHHEADPQQPAVIEAIISAEVMAEIQSAVRSLPENFRIVSMLGYFEGKKIHEIAKELDMSVNTVKKQKQRAIQLLRLKLTAELFLLVCGLALSFS